MSGVKKHIFLFFALAFFLSFALALSSCAPSYKRADGYAMGTFVAVSAEKEKTARALLPLVSSLEGEISHKISKSSIARLNRGESVALSEDLFSALSLCLLLEEKTNGAFSIRLLPISSLWDFENKTVPASDEIARALEEISASRLSLANGTASLSSGGIDLGAVGKGMATDVLARALREKNEGGLISVGGSIAAVGDKNGEGWRIGVRDPFSDSQSDTVGVLLLKNAFVSTSGSYEKTFSLDGKSYHHILNAQTGMPVDGEIVSVTVIADSGVLSDALSTAVFAVGMEKGVELCKEFGAEALFIKKDGSLFATKGFASVFEADERGVNLLEY